MTFAEAVEAAVAGYAWRAQQARGADDVGVHLRRPDLAWDIITDLIVREAGGEIWLGQLEVAWVVRCRVDAPQTWWGTPPLSVALTPRQFSGYDSWTTSDADPMPLLAEFFAGLRCSDPDARAAAAAVFAPSFRFGPPATHYHTTAVTPSGAEKLEFVQRIGGHRFYFEAGD